MIQQILDLCTVCLLGCIAVTSAEDGGAETTQYLILHGPDDGMVPNLTIKKLIIQQISNHFQVNDLKLFKNQLDKK